MFEATINYWHRKKETQFFFAMIIKLDFELKAITRETIFYENILFLYLSEVEIWVCSVLYTSK